MKIVLQPLETAQTQDLVVLLNDPRVTKHMPLAEKVDAAWVETWKRGKSSLWQTPQHGPWAVYLDERFAGWAGLQPDEAESAELAVVLHVWAWGRGSEIKKVVLNRWFELMPNHKVFVYLPKTRKAEQIAVRLGLRFDKEISFGQTTFERYELLQP